MKGSRIRWLVAGTALTIAGGAVASAFVGAAAWGVAVPLVLGLLLLTALRYVIRGYHSAFESAPAPLPPGIGAWALPSARVLPHRAQAAPAPTARVFTDERLRAAWRASFRDLQAWRPASQVLATVEQRQRYLDEFERRNPRGFTTWLASEARPSNIPPRYFRDDHPTQAAINWDELTRQRDV